MMRTIRCLVAFGAIAGLAPGAYGAAQSATIPTANAAYEVARAGSLAPLPGGIVRSLDLVGTRA